MLKKVTMNFSEDFLSKVDEYAKDMNINRTSAINVLVNNALDYARALKFAETVPSVLAEMRELTTENRKNE